MKQMFQQCHKRHLTTGVFGQHPALKSTEKAARMAAVDWNQNKLIVRGYTCCGFCVKGLSGNFNLFFPAHMSAVICVHHPGWYTANVDKNILPSVQFETVTHRSSPHQLDFHSHRCRCSAWAEEGTGSGCHRGNIQEGRAPSPP